MSDHIQQVRRLSYFRNRSVAAIVAADRGCVDGEDNHRALVFGKHCLGATPKSAVSHPWSPPEPLGCGIRRRAVVYVVAEKDNGKVLFK